MLTIELMIKLLDDYGMQYSERFFTGPVTPPFLIYYSSSTNNFEADDTVYYLIDEFTLELYSRVDSANEERKLESYLTENGILWERVSSTWIDTEKVTMTVYELS